MVLNVNELFHRHADSFGSILTTPTTYVAKNTPLRREMRAVELGGQEDWTSLDTVEDSGGGPYGGGPGPAFTIPKGYSGLWRFTVTGGSTLSLAGCVQTMWSLNSTQTSTGFPASSTTETAWTYQWCVASACIYPDGYLIEPQGVVVDRFSSGDELRFYTVARYPSGSTVSPNHGGGAGHLARVWAQFLGTTV